MSKKKVDIRLKHLIENGLKLRYRSMFFIIGDKANDQVPILYHMFTKGQVKERPSVLWVYKDQLDSSTHRKKQIKQISKKIKSGKLDVNDDDPFELFVASTNIKYCYYNETHKILGNTYGMLVLQDFETITPNLLARTIETVQGGGLILFLLKKVDSFQQFYTMSMEVHNRYRTESHQDINPRFNERFILSLASCKQCLVVDDSLNILPISSKALETESFSTSVLTDNSLSQEQVELNTLKESLEGTQQVSSIVSLCKTLDQAKAVLKFIDSIAEKTLRATVTLTAARGRGKSASLGLAIASAVSYGYSNIFITSPSPENLKTVFEFIFKGFDSLEYKENDHYDIVQSTNPEFNNAIIRVNIFKEHRQTIQYIHPSDAIKLGQAELVVIDEAAAIPLPLVKNLLGPYLVFMASTINGYEGTGRSLSLKLIQQLRQKTSSVSNNVEIRKQAQQSASGKVLHELELKESIRYGSGDDIEKWLNDLLCLNCCQLSPDQYFIKGVGCPVPDACELFYVNRDTLFSYHKVSEMFLQRLMSLYVASHYKNTPNDLQMLSDAPAHHVFCLLPPFSGQKTNGLPEILCVIQVCLEGEISKQSVRDNLQRGKRANGDLIPWTVSQQFQDDDFPGLASARVVRIATHPDYQGMGYGQRAMKLLQDYFEGKMLNLDEKAEKKDKNSNAKTVTEGKCNLLEEEIEPRKNLPPLLSKLTDRKAEKLSYLGVSFGLTSELLRFWKKLGYLPVYLRQTPKELTGEYSCIVLKELNQDEKEDLSNSWLYKYYSDFRKRFISLLAYQFRTFLPSLALNIMKQDIYPEIVQKISKEEADQSFNAYDFKRLDVYALNLVDYHLVVDLVPEIAKLYFTNKLGEDFNLSLVQSAILVGVGLQNKSIEDLEKELQLPPNQLLAMFNKIIKKMIALLENVQIDQMNKLLFDNKDAPSLSKEALEKMEPLKQSLEDELNEASIKVKQEELEKKKQLIGFDLKQYEIKGTEKEWVDALKLPTNSYVTIKRMGEKRKVDYESHFNPTEQDKEQNGFDLDQTKSKNKKGKFDKKNGFKNNKNKNKNGKKIKK